MPPSLEAFSMTQFAAPGLNVTSPSVTSGSGTASVPYLLVRQSDAP